MKKHLWYAPLAALLALPLAAYAGDTQREADVARRGADVMPFSPKATTHVFTKTRDGGTQRILAKNASDATQIQMAREHLHAIQAQFQRGDFSGPEHIHGSEIPGLAQLKAAKPDAIAISYRDVNGGAELRYRTADARLVSALHAWFDAQLSDHGADATTGHERHQHGDRPMP